MTVYRRIHTKPSSIILAIICIFYVSLSVACSDRNTTPATESVSTITPTGNPTSTATPEPTSTATPTPTATAIPTPTTITSNISGYSLSNITISTGTVIKWINSHAAPHTVTSGTPGNLSDIWDSDTISNGNSYSHTFSNSGTFQYFCKIHTSMRATVTVN